MKINAVLIPKSKQNISEMLFDKNFKFYLCTAVLSAAVITGIVIFSFNKTEAISDYLSIFECFLNEATTSDKLHVFLILAKNVLFYLLILSILSFCVVGEILIYIVSFIKFAGIGSFVSFLYTQYVISGIKYLFYVFLPGKIVFIIATLNLMHICIDNSRVIREKNRLPSTENRSLVIRLLFTIILIIISLLIDYFTINTFLPLTGILSFV